MVALAVLAASPPVAGDGIGTLTVGGADGIGASSAVATGPPTVTGVVPSNGPTAGGTSVAISGTNFEGTTVVDFGANAAVFAYGNPSLIIATSPAGSAGTVNVTVTTLRGTSVTSSADQFTYNAGCSPSLDFSDATGCNLILAGH